MKTTEIAVLGAAALAVYLILKTTKTTSGQGGAQKPVSEWVKEVFTSAGTPFDNGWRYYDNGVAISPAGEYYHNGQKVWSPT